MFAGFNVKIDLSAFSSFLDVGKRIFEGHKKQVADELNQYLNSDDSLNAKKIEEDWFPEIDAHVFLSHSHKDEEGIISFAGWLYEKFGIKSFIDSCIWECSDELLQKIDNKYCVSSRHPSGEITYSYKKRNASTSNVHIILSTALMKMINKTECFMLINTPSSVKWSDICKMGDSKKEIATQSPWIYNELFFSRLVHPKTIKEHRPATITEAMEWPNLEYSLNVDHLIDANKEDFDKLFYSEDWKSITDNYKAYGALDAFYKQKGINFDTSKDYETLQE